MLIEDRPQLSASLTNVQATSARIGPRLDNLKTTVDQGNVVLSHIDPVVVENRQDLRSVVVDLKQTLLTVSSLINQLKNTADFNSDNIDEMLVDLRVTTENIKRLTDTVKTRPSTLLRGYTVKDRQPSEN